MSIFAALTCLVFLAYIATSLALLAGTYFKSAARSFPEKNTAWPFLSVLIAARNEEKNLPACLASLLQTDYPHTLFEIIVIDDRSTDRTLALAQEYARAHVQVRVISVSQLSPGMSGKAGALARGVAGAAGEIFLFTDADCILPPGWMRNMAQHFSPGIGLAGGFTLLRPPSWALPFIKEERTTLFAKLQTLDWIYLLTLGAGAAGLGKPVSIIGNNFGMRREAYEQIGGHEALGFSIVEDFALMHKLARTTPWRVHFALETNIAIFSFPARGWKDFFDQRRRWTIGGREFGGWAQYLIVLALLCHAALAAAAFHSAALFGFGASSMLLMDFFVLWRGAAALQCRDLLKYFLPFRIYFLLYNLAGAPFFFWPFSVRWKGRRYRWNARRRLQAIEEES